MSREWRWDPDKARINKAKHGISFELAQRVLDDPDRATRLDPYALEERWQTIGKLGPHAPLVIVIVHTEFDWGGRIISARRATKHERAAYQEGFFL